MVLDSTWKHQVSSKLQYSVYIFSERLHDDTWPSRAMYIIGTTSLRICFHAFKCLQMNNWHRRVERRWGESWRILVVSRRWPPHLKPAVNSSTSLIRQVFFFEHSWFSEKLFLFTYYSASLDVVCFLRCVPQSVGLSTKWLELLSDCMWRHLFLMLSSQY